LEEPEYYLTDDDVDSKIMGQDLHLKHAILQKELNAAEEAEAAAAKPIISNAEAAAARGDVIDSAKQLRRRANAESTRGHHGFLVDHALQHRQGIQSLPLTIQCSVICLVFGIIVSIARSARSAKHPRSTNHHRDT